jgi:hypothetical protein
MQVLTVVNTMLGTLGESPLNALSDPHAFRGAAVAELNKADNKVQARGFWFNRELLTIEPNVADGRLYLPGDAISVMVPNRLDLVQRGRMLYDTVNGTNIFTAGVQAVIIRRVAFDELPETAAEYIAAKAVVSFQSQYDADNNKTALLRQAEAEARMEFNAENTRQARVNVIEINPRLMRLKSRIRQARIM